MRSNIANLYNNKLTLECFLFSLFTFWGLKRIGLAARTDYAIDAWFHCREKELAAVKINAAEVDIIANELEVVSPTLLISLHRFSS